MYDYGIILISLPRKYISYIALDQCLLQLKKRALSMKRPAAIDPSDLNKEDWWQPDGENL